MRKQFQDVANQWILEKEKYVKTSTISVYKLIVKRHLMETFGESEEIAESDVMQYVGKCLMDGISRKTIKDHLVVLKMIYQYGVSLNLYSPQNWKISFPTEQVVRRIDILSNSDFKKLRAYLVENFSFRNLGLYICLTTGLRIGEVCALNWNDIDVASGVIHVRKTIERIYITNDVRNYTKLIISTPKTVNSIRDVPISADLMKVFKPLKRVVNDDYYVITNDPRPTEPRTYRNYYKQVLSNIGIPYIKFHALRHSFATKCIESRCDYKTVSVILGHSSINTTLNLYVHPNNEQKKNVVNKMLRYMK